MSEDEKAYKISAELPGIDAKGQDEWLKMNIRAAVLATILLLTVRRERSTSSSPPTPLPPPVGQAVNAPTYLAQYRCSDGSPPNSCSAPVAQLTTDLEFYRKLDWPGPWSGIISDSVLSRSSGDDIIISTFSPAPFGAFNPPNDGGDVYGVDANAGNAVALKTRDGSLRADLYFVGENCGGGTGWVSSHPLYQLVRGRTSSLRSVKPRLLRRVRP